MPLPPAPPPQDRSNNADTYVPHGRRDDDWERDRDGPRRSWSQRTAPRDYDYDYEYDRGVGPSSRRLPSPPPHHRRPLPTQGSPPTGPSRGAGQKRRIDSVDSRSGPSDYADVDHILDHRRRSPDAADANRPSTSHHASRPSYGGTASRFSSPDRHRRASPEPVDKVKEMEVLERFLKLMVSTITALSQQSLTGNHVERLMSFTSATTSPAVLEASQQHRDAQEVVRRRMRELWEDWVTIFRRKDGRSTGTATGGGITLEALSERMALLERGMTGMLALGDKGKGRAVEMPLITPTSAPPWPTSSATITDINDDTTGDANPHKRQKTTDSSDRLAEALVKVDSMEAMLLGFDERFQELESWAYLTEGEQPRLGENAPVASWDELEDSRDPLRRLRGSLEGGKDAEGGSGAGREVARVTGNQVGPSGIASWDDLENRRDPDGRLRGQSTSNKEGSQAMVLGMGNEAAGELVMTIGVMEETLKVQVKKMAEHEPLVAVLRTKVRSMSEEIKVLQEDKKQHMAERAADKVHLEDVLAGMEIVIKKQCEKEFKAIKEQVEAEVKTHYDKMLDMVKEQCEAQTQIAIQKAVSAIRAKRVAPTVPTNTASSVPAIAPSTTSAVTASAVSDIAATPSPAVATSNDPRPATPLSATVPTPSAASASNSSAATAAPPANRAYDMTSILGIRRPAASAPQTSAPTSTITNPAASRPTPQLQVSGTVPAASTTAATTPAASSSTTTTPPAPPPANATGSRQQPASSTISTMPKTVRAAMLASAPPPTHNRSASPSTAPPAHIQAPEKNFFNFQVLGPNNSAPVQQPSATTVQTEQIYVVPPLRSSAPRPPTSGSSTPRSAPTAAALAQMKQSTPESTGPASAQRPKITLHVSESTGQPTSGHPSTSAPSSAPSAPSRLNPPVIASSSTPAPGMAGSSAPARPPAPAPKLPSRLLPLPASTSSTPASSASQTASIGRSIAPIPPVSSFRPARPPAPNPPRRFTPPPPPTGPPPPSAPPTPASALHGASSAPATPADPDGSSEMEMDIDEPEPGEIINRPISVPPPKTLSVSPPTTNVHPTLSPGLHSPRDASQDPPRAAPLPQFLPPNRLSPIIIPMPNVASGGISPISAGVQVPPRPRSANSIGRTPPTGPSNSTGSVKSGSAPPVPVMPDTSKVHSNPNSLAKSAVASTNNKPPAQQGQSQLPSIPATSNLPARPHVAPLRHSPVVPSQSTVPAQSHPKPKQPAQTDSAAQKPRWSTAADETPASNPARAAEGSKVTGMGQSATTGGSIQRQISNPDSSLPSKTVTPHIPQSTDSTGSKPPYHFISGINRALSPGEISTYNYLVELNKYMMHSFQVGKSEEQAIARLPSAAKNTLLELSPAGKYDVLHRPPSTWNPWLEAYLVSQSIKQPTVTSESSSGSVPLPSGVNRRTSGGSQLGARMSGGSTDLSGNPAAAPFRPVSAGTAHTTANTSSPSSPNQQPSSGLAARISKAPLANRLSSDESSAGYAGAALSFTPTGSPLTSDVSSLPNGRPGLPLRPSASPQEEAQSGIRSPPIFDIPSSPATIDHHAIAESVSAAVDGLQRADSLRKELHARKFLAQSGPAVIDSDGDVRMGDASSPAGSHPIASSTGSGAGGGGAGLGIGAGAMGAVAAPDPGGRLAGLVRFSNAFGWNI